MVTTPYQMDGSDIPPSSVLLNSDMKNIQRNMTGYTIKREKTLSRTNVRTFGPDGYIKRGHTLQLLEASYDPMVGVRTAISLGTCLFLLILYIGYKMKCSNRWQRGNDYFSKYQRKYYEKTLLRERQSKARRLLRRLSMVPRNGKESREKTREWIQNQPLYSSVLEANSQISNAKRFQYWFEGRQKSASSEDINHKIGALRPTGFNGISIINHSFYLNNNNNRKQTKESRNFRKAMNQAMREARKNFLHMPGYRASSQFLNETFSVKPSQQPNPDQEEECTKKPHTSASSTSHPIKQLSHEPKTCNLLTLSPRNATRDVGFAMFATAAAGLLPPSAEMPNINAQPQQSGEQENLDSQAQQNDHLTPQIKRRISTPELSQPSRPNKIPIKNKSVKTDKEGLDHVTEVKVELFELKERTDGKKLSNEKCSSPKTIHDNDFSKLRVTTAQGAMNISPDSAVVITPSPVSSYTKKLDTVMCIDDLDYSISSSSSSMEHSTTL